MRHLLLLTLAAVAAFSVAGCANVQPTRSAQAVGATPCRHVVPPGPYHMRPYCADDPRADAGFGWGDYSPPPANPTNTPAPALPTSPIR